MRSLVYLVATSVFVQGRSGIRYAVGDFSGEKISLAAREPNEYKLTVSGLWAHAFEHPAERIHNIVTSDGTVLLGGSVSHADGKMSVDTDEELEIVSAVEKDGKTEVMLTGMLTNILRLD